VLVVGFGNALCADDGAGPAVVARLLRGGMPPGVRAVDGGTDGLRLLSYWEGEEDVWLVDALRRGAPPGAVHHLDHDQLLAVDQPHESAHQLSLPECLRWLVRSHPGLAQVHFRLWGVEPERLDRREGLSPRVQAAVERVAAEIRERATVACETAVSPDPARTLEPTE
jgi:hydrogenase maturation protease